MSLLQSMPGLLELSGGEGILSLFEISILKPGDLIQGDLVRGESLRILFNGKPVGQADAIKFGEIAGFRVKNTDVHMKAKSEYLALDYLLEWVPFHLSIFSADFPLGKIKEMKADSWVSMGIPFDQSEKVKLLCAGIPLAIGSLVYVEDKISMRVDKILFEREVIEPSPPAGSFFQSQTAFESLDLRKPDLLTPPILNRLEKIHHQFCQLLSMRVKALEGLQLVSVQQKSLCQFYTTIEKGYQLYLSDDLTFYHIQKKNQIDIIEPENPMLTISEDSHDAVSQMVDLQNKHVSRKFIFACPEEKASVLHKEDSSGRILFSSLHAAWRGYCEKAIQSGEGNPVVSLSKEDLALYESWDMGMIYHFSTPKGFSIYLAEPFIVFEPFLSALER